MPRKRARRRVRVGGWVVCRYMIASTHTAYLHRDHSGEWWSSRLDDHLVVIKDEVEAVAAVFRQEDLCGPTAQVRLVPVDGRGWPIGASS